MSRRPSQPQQPLWGPDQSILATFEGAQELVSWFGFFPDFHDAVINQITFEGSNAEVSVAAFRMTKETDEHGYLVLDKHAIVTITLKQISSVSLNCFAPDIILESGFRKIADDAMVPHQSLVSLGDVEFSFVAVRGGKSLIFAKSVEFQLEPESSGIS